MDIFRLAGPLRLCDGGALVIFHRKEGIPMPTFISLYKLTDQGIKNIKEAPSRVEDAIKGAETMGAKVIGFYSVMGEYDYVAIGEFPSDEHAVTFAMALGSGGNVRTTTFRAFSKEEFSEMVKKLP